MHIKQYKLIEAAKVAGSLVPGDVTSSAFYQWSKGCLSACLLYGTPPTVLQNGKQKSNVGCRYTHRGRRCSRQENRTVCEFLNGKINLKSLILSREIGLEKNSTKWILASRRLHREARWAFSANRG